MFQLSFEFFFTIWHTLSDSVGILANVLLILLVIFKTPDSLKNYSVLILNCAIFDLIACATALLVQQRVIATGDSLFFMPSGPCRLIGARHGITIHCYAHSMYSLTISFVYRYLVIREIKVTRRTLVLILLAVYPLSLLQLITFASTFDDQEAVSAVIRDRFPSYEIDSRFVSGAISILEWKMLYVTLHICLPVFPCYLIIFWCRQKTIAVLRKTRVMSERSKQMHSTLLSALTYQILLPGLFISAVVTYFLGASKIYNHPWLELSVFLIVGFVPALAPIGTLYFVLPYNRWIRRNVLLRAQKVTPASTYGEQSSQRVFSLNSANFSNQEQYRYI